MRAFGDNTERNRRVIELYEDGMSCADIGRSLDQPLSHSAVCCIVKTFAPELLRPYPTPREEPIKPIGKADPVRALVGKYLKDPIT